MSKFRYCPNPSCQSSLQDSQVYQCTKCGHVGCFKNTDFSPVSFLHSGHGCWKKDNCPNCGALREYRILGYVTKNID